MGFMFCSFTTIMEINKEFLGKLFELAVVNPRLRQNFDLRTSANDNSQRMLNALLPGTVVPIHRHPQSTESVFLLCGKIVEVICDENGNEIERIHLTPPLVILAVLCHKVHGIQWKYWNLRLYTRQRTENMVRMAVRRLMLSKQRKRKTRNWLQPHSPTVLAI